jgi:ribonuclease BN (tRNA processing enzyme)
MLHGAWAHPLGCGIDMPDRSMVISGDGTLIEAARGCDVLLHKVYSEQALEHGRKDDPAWAVYLHQVHTLLAQLAEFHRTARTISMFID